jgi:hypothetical protein
MNVTTYTSPFGALARLPQAAPGHEVRRLYRILVDMDNVAYRYLANDEMSRDTKLLTNRQANDQDGRKDEFLSECGFQAKLQSTHAVLTGITS